MGSGERFHDSHTAGQRRHGHHPAWRHGGPGPAPSPDRPRGGPVSLRSAMAHAAWNLLGPAAWRMRYLAEGDVARGGGCESAQGSLPTMGPAPGAPEGEVQALLHVLASPVCRCMPDAMRFEGLYFAQYEQTTQRRQCVLGHVRVACLPGHHHRPAEGPRHGLSIAQLHHGRRHARGAAGLCHIRAHARQWLRAQQQRNSCCAAAACCCAGAWPSAVLG